MDQFAIATAVLSLSTPGTYLADGPVTAAEAGVWARRVNDINAELVKERPDRFGVFVTLFPRIRFVLSHAEA